MNPMRVVEGVLLLAGFGVIGGLIAVMVASAWRAVAEYNWPFWLVGPLAAGGIAVAFFADVMLGLCGVYFVLSGVGL